MAQEGTLKVLGGLATFRGDSRFTTWAITVTVRVAFTELRRARWRDVSLDRLVEDAPARLPAAPPADGSSQDARQAIDALMRSRGLGAILFIADEGPAYLVWHEPPPGAVAVERLLDAWNRSDAAPQRAPSYGAAAAFESPGMPPMRSRAEGSK